MLNIGQKGPDFTLPGVDHQTYTLSALVTAHKAVAVIFSCNHCPYVLAWEDRMLQIQSDYQAQGVALVAIGSNDAVKYPQDDFEHMQQHAQQKGFNFLYLRDESQEIAHAYGGSHTPHVFLLDGEGKLCYRGAIDDNYDEPNAVQHTYLRDALDAVLSGTVPDPAETPAVGCTIKWK